MNPRDKRAREIQDSIREVLMLHWDPIHVREQPENQDAYGTYIGGIYRLLAIGATALELAEHLASVERSSMGFSTEAKSMMPVARQLRRLDVRF